MNFTLTEDQRAFADAIAKFLMVEAAPEKLRELWETDTGQSEELRAQLANQGLTAISVSEKFGGLELGDVDWLGVNELIGYHAISETLHQTSYLAVDVLQSLSSQGGRGQALAEQWLPKVVAGEIRIALVHPINPLTPNAACADLLLICHEDAVHAIAPADCKLSINASIDQSRRLHAVDWAPNAESEVCNSQDGAAIWRDVINRAGLAISAQLLGLASRMLDLGVDYGAQRKQFGKPIGSFQAVKHQLADVAVKIEFARPVVQRAAYAVQAGQEHRDAAVSHAKLAAGEAALLAARRSMQVHGAMGYTWETDLQMFMKRAWALNTSWGDQGFHKTRVAGKYFAENAEIGPQNTFT